MQRPPLMAILVLSALPLACRDAPTRYTPPARDDAAVTSPVRLTYNAGSDITPSWSRGSDSVYYSAPGFDVFPRSAGILLGVPAAGGAARLLVPSVQAGGFRFLVAPVVSPDGQRVAYVDIQQYGTSCFGATGVDCGPDLIVPPGAVSLRLATRAVLYVRSTSDGGPLSLDARLDLNFPGTETLAPGQLRTHVTARHMEFDRNGRAFFRPSWSPDGTRVVFSDGVALHVWTVGQETAPVIPNTQDGIEPAWSPDGNWIAYRRPIESEITRRTCRHSTSGGVQCLEERIFYTLERNVLTVIRTDGSGRQELGEGVGPAWAPDSNTLYFNRFSQIWRIQRDGTGAAPLAGATGAQVAVSPDGSSIAYVVGEDAQQKDIWAARLSAP